MEWSDPNVVLVSQAASGKSRAGRWISSSAEGPGRWALPEDAFEHRAGMITKPETRALDPRPARSRSGGSGLGRRRRKRLRRRRVRPPRSRRGRRRAGSRELARVRRNADRHGVCVRVVEGDAPAALRDLPQPDAVFVGGTGGMFEDIVKLCAVRARRAVVLSLVTLERVVPAGRILEGCGLDVETTILQASRVKGVGRPAPPRRRISGLRRLRKSGG